MNLIEIGGRIKAYRKSIGISQEKLAEMIDVSPHYIYEIERGSKSMSLEMFVRLSKVLNLSTDYILFGNQTSDTVSLVEQLAKMDEKQRERAESAFKALLPYIK
ncbi:MAG: helix-turn-helix transcriptional regulator [Ruminiclostridium sp.]|nr:helix-turn-helix transcriptional regulator [Ruminiclostridium sp.]